MKSADLIEKFAQGLMDSIWMCVTFNDVQTQSHITRLPIYVALKDSQHQEM